MAFDANDPRQVSEALTDIKRRASDFFGSTEYQKAVARWERRRDAFYCRPPADAPIWRSKLYLPTFFLGATALMAQFRAGRQGDDWLWVTQADDSNANPEVKELAELAQKDMRYDLTASDFASEQAKMEWYVAIFGTAVAREFIRIHDHGEDAVPVVGNRLGNIEEITGTQVIHPLNFGHELDKPDFKRSDWGCVRFLLHVSEVYKMRGNPDYYQPGVEKLIEAVQNRKSNAATDAVHYYSDTDITVDKAQRYIVVTEYSGPLWHMGNEGDDTLYYALYTPDSDIPLRIGPNPFGRHPFWKESSWCDPGSPWGIGPNDFLLPINAWENSTVNQYIDYANSSLKFLWKVNPDAVEGGLRTLASAVPNSMIPVARGAVDNGLWNQMIEPIRSTQGGLPPVSDVIGLINKYKEEVGPSSNLRGKGSDQLTDTATGIQLMAEREDQAVDAIMSGIDAGLSDGMMIKWSNRTKFFTNPRRETTKHGHLVEYFPYELAALGRGVTFKVRRRLADTEAGKRMNFIRMLGALDQLMQQRGTPLPLELMVDSYRDLGRALGVEDIDERFESINKMLKAPAPAPEPAGGPVPMPGAGPEPMAPPPVDMPLPVGQQDIGASVPPIGELGDQMALA